MYKKILKVIKIMNWNNYQAYHKQNYGAVSKIQLSQDYKEYKKETEKPVDRKKVIETPKSRKGEIKHLRQLSPSRAVFPPRASPTPTRASPIRASPTRGWAEAAPKPGKERHELKKACGDKAFLMPKSEKFPIVPAQKSPVKNCAVACTGVQAAKNRACQTKNVEVAKKAQAIGVKNCGWNPKTSPCRK